MAIILQSMFEIFNQLGKHTPPVRWTQLGNRFTAEIQFQKLPSGFMFVPTSSDESEEDDTSLVGKEFPSGYYLATIFAPPLSMMKPLSELIDLSNPKAKAMKGADISFAVVLKDEQGQLHSIYSDLNLPPITMMASVAHLSNVIKEKLELIQPAILTYSGAGKDIRRKKVYDYIGNKMTSGYVRVPNDALGLAESSSLWLDKNQMRELPAAGKLASWIENHNK